MVRRLRLASQAAVAPSIDDEPVLLDPVEWSAASLAESARFEPDDGVYAVFSTQDNGRVVRLSAHLDRLADSAERTGIAIDLRSGSLNRRRLRGALAAVYRDCVETESVGTRELKFRITIAHDARTAIIAAEPFAGIDPQIRSQGVACETVLARRDDPQSKTTAWLHSRQSLRERTTATGGAAPYELLLVDDGCITEGASSNFYAIASGGARRLITAEEGILRGIARSIVIETARGLAQVERRAPTLDEVRAADEAFLSSASRGIIPIVRIDGLRVGTGSPGDLTRALIGRYAELAAASQEPLAQEPGSGW